MAECLIALAKFVGKQTNEIEEVVQAFFKKNTKYTIDFNLINVTIKNIVHLDTSEETPEQIQLHYRLYISIIQTTIERIESDDKHKIHFNKLINHLSANAHCEKWLLKALNIVNGNNLKIETVFENDKLVNLYTIMDNHSSSKKLHNIICRYLSIISSLDPFGNQINTYLTNILDLFVVKKLSSTQTLKIFAHIFTLVYNNENTNKIQAIHIRFDILIRHFQSLIYKIYSNEIKKREVCKNNTYINTVQYVSEILMNMTFDYDYNIELEGIIENTIKIAQYYKTVFKVCNEKYKDYKDIFIQYQDTVSMLFSSVKIDFKIDFNKPNSMCAIGIHREVLRFLKQDDKYEHLPHTKFVEVLEISLNYEYYNISNLIDDNIFYLIDYYLTFELSDKFCIYMNNRLAKTDDISLGVKYITKLLESNMKYWERCDNFYKVANYVRRNLSSHTYLHDIYKILLINFNKYKTNRKYLADILYIMSKYIHTTSPFSVKELQVFKQNLPFIKKTIISYSENTPKEILYKYHLKKQYNYLSKKANIMYWKKMSDDLVKDHH